MVMVSEMELQHDLAYSYYFIPSPDLDRRDMKIEA